MNLGSSVAMTPLRLLGGGVTVPGWRSPPGDVGRRQVRNTNYVADIEGAVPTPGMCIELSACEGYGHLMCCLLICGGLLIGMRAATLSQGRIVLGTRRMVNPVDPVYHWPGTWRQIGSPLHPRPAAHM